MACDMCPDETCSVCRRTISRSHPREGSYWLEGIGTACWSCYSERKPTPAKKLEDVKAARTKRKVNIRKEIDEVKLTYQTKLKALKVKLGEQ